MARPSPSAVTAACGGQTVLPELQIAPGHRQIVIVSDDELPSGQTARTYGFGMQYCLLQGPDDGFIVRLHMYHRLQFLLSDKVIELRRST